MYYTCDNFSCPYYNWSTEECDLGNDAEECDEAAMTAFEDGEF